MYVVVERGVGEKCRGQGLYVVVERGVAEKYRGEGFGCWGLTKIGAEEARVEGLHWCVCKRLGVITGQGEGLVFCS